MVRKVAAKRKGWYKSLNQCPVSVGKQTQGKPPWWHLFTMSVWNKILKGRKKNVKPHGI